MSSNSELTIPGSCTCGSVQYTLTMDSADAARTSLCHCHSCRKAFGTNFGLTTKVPLSGFKYTKGQPKVYQQANGVNREFCQECGVFLCEYGVR
jgi:hypothetical protein